MSTVPEQTPDANPRISPAGNWVVLGMFGFALVMVLLLWGYWELYTRPFRPLQIAIAEAFPGSSPAVIGGKHKSHKDGNPYILRIVVRVPSEDFNPETAPDQSAARAKKLVRMADERLSLETYEQIEVRLIQRVPEKEWLKWSESRPAAAWLITEDPPAQ